MEIEFWITLWDSIRDCKEMSIHFDAISMFFYYYFFLCIVVLTSLCLFACVWVHKCVQLHICVYVWKSKVNVKCVQVLHTTYLLS